MAIAHPTPPDEAPPPAPQPTNLESALGTVVAALEQTGDNAVGDVLRLQDTIQANNLTLTQDLLLEAADGDAPSHLEALVAQSLSISENRGLVNWIPYDSKQTKAEESTRTKANDIVLYLNGLVANSKGKEAGAWFEEFLKLYILALGIEDELSTWYTLSDLIDILQYALQWTGKINNVLNDAVSRVIRACKDVCKITNRCWRSSEDMTDEEAIKLCGCFIELGAAMPIVAEELPPPPPSPSTGPHASVAEAVKIVPPNTNADDLLQENQHVGTVQQQQSPTTAASSNHTPATTSSTPLSSPPPVETRGCEAVPRSPMLSPRPSRSSATTATATAPTQAALEASVSYTRYYDRPAEPNEQETNKTHQFKRMLNYMAHVLQASLCLFPSDHDASCPKSRSSLEVMSYNPFYKLFNCRQRDHYHGLDDVDDTGCVACRIDMCINLLGDISEAKSKRCVRDAQCDDDKCKKSHSFAEMCWFNPSYKTAKCDPTRCRRSPLECFFAHEGETVRELTNEDDYIGKNIQILFIEPTLKELADKLEQLYVGARDRTRAVPFSSFNFHP